MEWKGRRRKKVISITISEELLREIDGLAKKYGISRTDFIVNAIMEKIERLKGG